jgi:Ni/Co efflux regulator RcnB
MKRAAIVKPVALGALCVTLLAAGSAALAGQGFRGNDNRGDHHSDNRGGHDNRHHDGNRHDWNGGRHDDHSRNDWSRRHDDRDRHDWNRGRDDHHRNDWNRDRDHNWHGDRHDWNRDRHDWNRDNWRSYNPPRYYNPPRHYSAPRYYAPPRYGYDRPRYHYGSYVRPYGYYSHRWTRGEYLPRAYYDRPYVVYNYDGYGLRAPPYGYHWVRVDPDVVLAAIATGVILDVAYNHFY